jgi:hypothetical protein
MNERIPVHNPTQMPIYVGATMIPAGETRHFDLEDVPHHLRPAVEAAPDAEPAPAADLVADLRKKPIKDVLDGVEVLNDADLQRLIDLETADEKPRKSLLTELGELQLKRAEEAEAALRDAGQGGQS